MKLLTLFAWVLDNWFSYLPIDLVSSSKPWLQEAPLWCFRSSMLLCFTSVFSCLPKCVQGLVQLEIGRLRAGSWASSRKTSQNSQVGDVFLADSLSCTCWEEVAHLTNDYLEMMSDIHIFTVPTSVCFRVFEMKMKGGVEIH